MALDMENVKMERKGDTLVVLIELSRKGHPSKTGKSMIIATTKGSKPVPGAPGVEIGLNVYKK